jgi:CheY-like chemotaxis protein
MPGAQVLVLDDDEAVRETFVDALERAGYSVVGLAAGVEALSRLEEIGPDLIVLDMAMPEMDGFEFLARLRASSARRDVPVLIVSALGEHLRDSIDAPGAASLRIAGILPKTTSLDTLLDHVAAVIARPRP